MTPSLFILGCQRSGTTMLLDVLRQSPHTECFGEADRRVMRNTRLVSMDAVRAAIAGAAPRVAVLKPLCDAQHADELLGNIDGSRAVWLYREPHDVIHSSQRKWPNNATEVLARFRDRSWQWLGWRAERVGDDWLAELARFADEDVTEADASALFWLLRNDLYFARGLAETDLVLPVKDEELVTRPAQVLPAVFGMIGVPFASSFASQVNARSVGRGPRGVLRADIEDRCHAMLDRLDAAWRERQG